MGVFTREMMNVVGLAAALMAPISGVAQVTDAPATSSASAAQTGGAYAATSNTTMNPADILASGGSQPHENMPPYLVLNFIIALQGIFPSQN